WRSGGSVVGVVGFGGWGAPGAGAPAALPLAATLGDPDEDAFNASRRALGIAIAIPLSLGQRLPVVLVQMDDAAVPLARTPNDAQGRAGEGRVGHRAHRPRPARAESEALGARLGSTRQCQLAGRERELPLGRVGGPCSSGREDETQKG